MNFGAVARLLGYGSKLRKRVPHLLVFAGVAALYLSGGLNFVEYRLTDLRFQLAQRDAGGGLVLVEIDPASLQEIEVWPWPRGLYAVALDKLLAAGARRVAFDVDFSTPSVPEEDRRLEKALARSDGKAILPVFKQFSSAGDGGRRLTLSVPIAEFRQHARLAFINVRPEADGLVRRMAVRESWDGRELPSLSASLANAADARFGSFYLDYGIRPSSIRRISFVDVLRGNFDTAAVAGKQVLIGATAVELGDQLAVPVHRVAAGPLIQALAYESLALGRAMLRIAPLPVLFVGFLLAFFLGPQLAEWSWRRGLAVVLSASAVLWPLTLAVQALAPVLLDITPWILVILLTYAVALVSRVDQQAVRLLFQSIDIRRNDVMMRNVVENSFDGIVTMDGQGMIESINIAASRMFDYPPGEIVGRHVGLLVSGLSEESRDKDLSNTLKVGRGPHETEGRRKGNMVFPMETAVTEIRTDNRRHLTAFVRDITLQKKRQQALEHQALHDALTGLPNRTLLFDRLESAIAFAQRTNNPLAVLLIDLDRFKEVNDTLGHHMGDILLKQVSSRLQGHMRKSDTVARLGGDEFALLLPQTADLETARRLAGKILRALEKPFKLPELTLDISASIGIAMFPQHGDEAAGLIQMADVAMYTAKQDQSGFAVYDAEKDQNSVRHLTLSGELRRAIEGGQLVLHYQPKVSLEKGRIVGAEALVRWQHPKHGFMPPDEFIGLAEQTGLIRPLTFWVLDTAARQCAEWRRDGLEIEVAVNLSARHLQDLELPDLVGQVIEKWGLSPDWLALEVTENAIMLDPERAMKVIEDLDARGIRLAIDDFGTGYSSLAYLKDLPADELKIDKSFVLDMDRDKSNLMIVESTINLAHSLGLTVIAEGIETEEVCERLAALGCDLGQGYLFSRPLAIAEFNRWLAESPWGLCVDPPRKRVAAGG